MRLLGILVSLLVGCVVFGEGALLGSKKCTYGPSYWCDSLVKAKECSAVRHCIQTVWERTTLPEDNDDICTLCKNMVQEARDQLLSNETQEEIREVFDGSCRLIPVKLISDECIHLANDFIPELIDTLASEMNPQLVCATAGLCNSIKVDRLLLEYKRDHPNAIIPRRPPARTPQPGDCEACKDFVERTIRLVKTHSRAELMDRLFAICGRLGSLSDGCMALVEANFDSIYNFLTQQLNPDDFCDLVEMCEPQIHEPSMYQRPPLPHTGDEPCDFCVAIVQHWRDVLTANTTEEEFKQILDGLCRQMGSFSQNCLSLVDEYYLPLYNILVAEIDPKEICEAVGLCGLNSVFAVQHPVWTILDVERPSMVPQTRLIPAVTVDDPAPHMTGTDEAAAINFENQQQQTQQLPRVKLSRSGIAVSPVGQSGMVGAAVGKNHVGDDTKCVMCEFALHFLQNMLEQKDTREDIEHAVESLCDMMPRTVAEECEDYVEAYGDQVIELLVQEIDPSQICPLLHLCPSENQVVAAAPEVKDDVSCVMCEYAMTQLEDMLKDNKTEAGIRHALDQLCSMLPKTVEADCEMFVDTYTDQVIQMLIDDFTPDQICIQLHLCKPREPELPRLDSSNQLPVSRMFVGVPSLGASNHQTEESMGQSTVCVLCEFAMLQVDKLLLTNATEDEIIEIVDFVCAHLPGTLQDDCIGFVEQYGDAIIKLLVHQLDPKEVCQELKLCKPPKYSGLRATLNLNLDKCGVCEFVVTEVDDRLKDPEVVIDLDSDIEQLCRFLPGHAAEECRNIVEVYGPYLVNLLRELLEPQKVCESVHLCPSTSDQPLLGGEKCTWGPSYWCQTQVHAAACKATMHCQQTVWQNNTPQI